MKFKPFTYEDIETVAPYLERRTVCFSDLTLGYIAMWKDELNIRWCIENEILYLAQDIGDGPAFFPPLGGDLNQALDVLIKYVNMNHLPLRLFCLGEEMVAALRSDPRFHHVPAVYDERWSDYVYTAESARTFRGKKLNGQRNHVNRYTKLYGPPDARLLSSEDIPLIREMLEDYKAEHPERNLIEDAELSATYELLGHFEELHQVAAGLFAEDKLIAFSIGEVIGNMLDIHVEKALLAYKGAYPVMYQNFVRLVSGLHDDLELVNREDDSGDPGLRTSKNQYHPLKQLHKYFTNVNAPDPDACSETIPAGPVVLTPMRESDRPGYYRLCTDPEISRWWGYDYENDYSITSAIDEDLFYDMAQHDMAAGESVNYAVRETADGEMIGEVIIWNMTFDGYAEIGCRLASGFHGRGYGRAAFRAAVDLVRDRLHRVPRAKCYKKNTASEAMILSSGLSKTGEDDTFYYFE